MYREGCERKKPLVNRRDVLAVARPFNWHYNRKKA